jgi:flagellar protein FlaG
MGTDATAYVKPPNSADVSNQVKITKSTADGKRQPAELSIVKNDAPSQPIEEINQEAFIQAIEETNKYYQPYDKMLQFSIHEATKQIMVKIINIKTDEIIAEIPSEKILDMIAKIWEMAGLLIDKKA